MSYSFIHRGGHIEVVDAMGRFVLSADTIAEAHKGRRKESIYGRDFRKNAQSKWCNAANERFLDGFCEGWKICDISQWTTDLSWHCSTRTDMRSHSS